MEALRQFDLLSDEVGNKDTSLTVDHLLKGLAWYFSHSIRFKNTSVQFPAV